MRSYLLGKRCGRLHVGCLAGGGGLVLSGAVVRRLPGLAVPPHTLLTVAHRRHLTSGRGGEWREGRGEGGEQIGEGMGWERERERRRVEGGERGESR